MKTRLNITNGESAVSKLRQAGVQGEIIPWQDVLHEGPVNASLSLHDLSELRALFIAERGWDDFAHVSGSFGQRDRTLANLDRFGEIVLWFEDDLYDQLQLLQLLDFFARTRDRKARLSMIVVDGYLASLTPAALAELEPKRAAVTEQQLDLGKRAWAAFGSADPSAIERLIDTDTSALRFLTPALLRHLEEFPDRSSGLSRSEAEALRAIESGHATPVAAFLEVARHQPSIFLGDIVFYWYLERMSEGATPLVTWKDGSRVVAPRGKEDSREFVTGELQVTDLGRQVLAGKQDWQRLNRNSRWLGGVEIKPGASGWRWDSTAKALVRA
ncbi:MAG TPA: DUF1835 domain-containing protein [Gemmatimonadaceae bacterium]|nr:DUF1835 domain-containing protein [Gemmatimonadaceae bacterium]